MNLHEYQGKEILASYGVRVQRGYVANNAEEAVAKAKQLTSETGTGWHVIKAQIHAGGRGKGGGVKLAKNLDQVAEIAGQIIGMDLITPQTPPQGKRVHKVLVAEDVYYPGESETKEFYMSVLLNRGAGRNMIMYSTEGGMDIEEVAEHTPHLIFTEEIVPSVGLQGFQARQIAFNLGLSGEAFKEMVKFVDALYKAYIGSDATMFEINPVLKTSDNKIIFCLSDGRITDYGQFITGNIGELFKTRNRLFKASYYEIWDKVPGTKQDYWLNRMYFHIYKIDEDSTKEYVLLHTDPIDDDITHGDYKRSPHIHIKDISDDNIAHAHIALNITDYDEAFSNITNLNDCFQKHVKMIANQILKI